MRLFIAIPLPPFVRQTLAAEIQRLQQAGATGRFIPPEQLHLTLAFLGETQKAREVSTALERVHQPSFSFTLEGLGTFPRPQGDILWRDIPRGSQLTQLYHKVWGQLEPLGFAPDRRPFRPHVTLGRQVLLPPNGCLAQIEVPSLSVPVHQILLLQSYQQKDKLTYIPLYEKILP